MSGEDKRDARLMKVGIVGTVFAALCCFTPFLVVLLGVVGLSAVVGYLDYVLFPALAAFVLLTFYAMWRWRARAEVIVDREDS